MQGCSGFFFTYIAAMRIQLLFFSAFLRIIYVHFTIFHELFHNVAPTKKGNASGASQSSVTLIFPISSA